MPVAPATPIVEVDRVSMRFGRQTVLHEVSFGVQRGETVCILGGSGGGKSTLLKIMIGALRPTSGEVRLDGAALSRLQGAELDRLRRRFGVMFQGGALLNSLTVAENVALPLRYHSQLDDDTIATVVKIKLHQVDLLAAADRLPSELSGGMLKRAAVARALALDPKVLFYDEPSAGLDPIATRRLDDLIRGLQRNMGMTNVVVTHVIESVRRIADRVVMLHRGEVVLDGSLADLEDSADPRVQRFIAASAEDTAADAATSTQDYLRDLLL